MKSMTGFGTGKKSTEALDVEINIKAVNGRFFEFKPHLPRDFADFESTIKNHLKTVFKRGSVDVYISRRYTEKGVKVSVETHSELLKSWVKGFNNLSKTLRLNDPIEMQTALEHCPEILRVEEKPVINTQVKKAVIEALKAAAENCDSERQREGAALKKELLSLLVSLQAKVTEMGKLKKQAIAALKKRYEERLQNLGLPKEADPQRIAQEVVIQVDKADIAEEITRLNEHIRAFKTLAGKNGTVGKKLDFYTQELLREVNTIGSKSQVAKLTAVVVEAKSIIERIREQVQNIE